MYKELEMQAFNRNQDVQGVYMYNDFTAYGVNEVIDNWVSRMHIRWLERLADCLLIRHSLKTLIRRFQRRQCLHMSHGASLNACPCFCSWTTLISGFVSYNI